MSRPLKALFPIAVAGVLAWPSVASAGSWRSLISVDPNSSRPVVVGDFVEAGTIKDGRYAVDRVRLRDRQRTTVPLATDALKPPEGVNDQSKLPYNLFEVSRFAFTDGLVIGQGVWIAAPPGGFDTHGGFGTQPSPTATMAFFDAMTGALVRQEDVPAAAMPFLESAAPAVLGEVTPSDRRPTGVFREAVSGRRLPISLPRTEYLFGGPLVRYYASTKRSRWKWDEGGSLRGGYGDLRAVEWATGRRAWTVNTASVARRAAQPKRRSSVEITLTDDGAAILRVFGSWRDGLRPVAVRRSGTLLRIGRRLPGVENATATAAGDRVIVEIDGIRQTKKKRRTACHGIWVTDLHGRRGRKLALPRNPGTLVGWDGDRATWSTWSMGDLHAAIRARSGLARIALSTRDVPRCT